MVSHHTQNQQKENKMENNGNMAEVKHICDFRKNELFEIPPYQRLYEWKKEQIETLLDDMKKAFDESKENYFISNITTSIKSENEQKIYVLIDGQQRLTTLWFIGFYLANRECECSNDKQKVWQNFILKAINYELICRYAITNKIR